MNVFNNFEKLTNQQTINLDIGTGKVNEFKAYVKERMNRDIGMAVAERLGKGEAGIIIPLGTSTHDNLIYDRTSTVTMEALTKFIPVDKMNPFLAGHLFDLLLENKFVRVPLGYEVRHIHHTPQLNLSFIMRGETDSVTIREGRTELHPVYNPKTHEQVGMAGKCEECGKIFYATIKEEDVW